MERTHRESLYNSEQRRLAFKVLEMLGHRTGEPTREICQEHFDEVDEPWLQSKQF